MAYEDRCPQVRHRGPAYGMLGLYADVQLEL